MNDFFHTVKLGAPQVFHFLEAYVHVRTEFTNSSIGFSDALIRVAQTGVVDQIPTSMVGAVLKAMVRIWVSVISTRVIAVSAILLHATHATDGV